MYFGRSLPKRDARSQRLASGGERFCFRARRGSPTCCDFGKQFGDLIRPFHVYLLYARRAFAEQSPETVRAFLAAWFETITYMHEHRAETIDIMRRTADVSNFIAARDYDAMIGMFNRTGRYNPEALKVVTRSFVEMGLLPTEPDITPLITEKYLPAK